MSLLTPSPETEMSEEFGPAHDSLLNTPSRINSLVSQSQSQERKIGKITNEKMKKDNLNLKVFINLMNLKKIIQNFWIGW